MRVYWLVLCFLFPFVALAQNGLITGRVTIAGTKTPVAQANVFLSNTTAGSATDNDGNYALRNLRPGEYTFVVSIVGYEDHSETIHIASTPITINVELSPK